MPTIVPLHLSPIPAPAFYFGVFVVSAGAGRPRFIDEVFHTGRSSAAQAV